MNQDKIEQALKNQAEAIRLALETLMEIEFNHHELTEAVKRRIPPQ